MIIEYGQLLSTAHRVLDGKPDPGPKRGPYPRYTLEDPVMNEGLYMASHVNNKCAIWARETADNYLWLYEVFCHLGDEFVRRFKKDQDHLTIQKLKKLLHTLPKNIPDGDMTMPPLAMPDEYKMEDPVLSYRNLYNGDKARFAVWTDTPTPTWFRPQVK